MIVSGLLAPAGAEVPQFPSASTLAYWLAPPVKPGVTIAVMLSAAVVEPKTNWLLAVVVEPLPRATLSSNLDRACVPIATEWIFEDISVSAPEPIDTELDPALAPLPIATALDPLSFPELTPIAIELSF